MKTNLVDVVILCYNIIIIVVVIITTIIIITIIYFIRLLSLFHIIYCHSNLLLIANLTVIIRI